MLVARVTRALVTASVFYCASATAGEPSAEARRLYAEGKAEYAQGHYVEAVQLFERSYALSESPALLFNMAQAHRLAGPEHCSDAVSLYKSYLAAQPEAENKQEVLERIQQLGDCAAQQPPPTPVAPAAPAPAPPASASSAELSQTTKRSVTPVATGVPVGPVVTAGGGAALLVAGGVLYGRAWAKHREAEKVCPCYPGTYSTWEVLTNVSYALMAAGGATLAGGVTWWVVGAPSAKGEPAQALLGVSGRF